MDNELPEELLQEFNALDRERLSQQSVLDGVQMALDVAGMAPDSTEDFESSVHEAFESVARPQAKAQSTPAYSVSLSGPNRIAVEGKKIINAIYDNTQLEVQTDALTGQIFVFPKSEVASALFLTTDDKSTYALTLLPQNTRSQEIVLKSIEKQKKTNVPYKQKTFAESIEASPDFEAKVTRLIRALARDEVPEGFHASNRYACRPCFNSQKHFRTVCHA